ncbi:hypothetical protein [Burkholderia plantarii]|uniref:Permease n=1 Tax=Burkholderia plantarii TaxID=41899 RepID=A0A0B6S417_BURPL|nr:hypothetical protein [Burkholderia plantarii]AJK49159.1 hypothetical protein BGL_2c10810 [Burkholderia plantarii]WLE62462.1 hypothetical protein GIY62_34370 [Burkholderia plantarii]
MDRKEARAKVRGRLAAGETKSEVFRALSGQGVKDRALAFLIASHLDPRRYEQNRIHVRIVIAVACLQLIIGLLTGAYLGVTRSPVEGSIVGGVVVVMAGLFLWGFATHNAGAYNAFLLVAIAQWARQLREFAVDPGGAAVALGVSIAIFAYVWFVRSRLFPDFAFIGPRKAGGQYVFTE